MIRPVHTIGAVTALCAAILSANWYFSDHDYPEARSYIVSEDPEGDVDAALARAAENDKRVLLVMGANWCHDSRALAGWLGTQRFSELIEDRYELVYVNVGKPQEGDGHNIDIARRFGVADLPGTPNVLVLTHKGELVNADTVTTWRNAASRSENEIFDELAKLAG
ncbi:thioredoxin family protein [Erythrobacter sp. THAF29]|uniref:thioredoxin family protein n=1 Tax=Erythrobacter sp. THAF29 TaxID=2587851 RepID=UPI0012696D61|nr:thioredoxin family protein [Erythrobacter sp. THAF29]QFT78930.1 hypothetical protein FIU90_15385 [Erythrobacter sp. THAF29]